MNRYATLVFGAALSVTLPPVAFSQTDTYAAGYKALNESRWSDAVTAFGKVADSKDKHADAALYWKAYSLNKLAKPDLAADTCRQLQAQYKTSPWIKDCVALRLSGAEWSRDTGSTNDPNHYHFHFDFDSDSSHPKDPDTDLKILALNSLVNRDPAQAMPILRDILTNSTSADLKHHALFVLAQSHSQEAQILMHDLVLGKQDTALQRQAIQASGVYLGRRGNDALVEAYQKTTDPQVKHAVVSALFVSNDDVRMVALARAEKTLT